MIDEVAFSNIVNIVLTVGVLAFVFVLPIFWLGKQLLARAEKELAGKSVPPKDGEETGVAHE